MDEFLNSFFLSRIGKFPIAPYCVDDAQILACYETFERSGLLSSHLLRECLSYSRCLSRRRAAPEQL